MVDAIVEVSWGALVVQLVHRMHKGWPVQLSMAVSNHAAASMNADCYSLISHDLEEATGILAAASLHNYDV